MRRAAFIGALAALTGSCGIPDPGLAECKSNDNCPAPWICGFAGHCIMPGAEATIPLTGCPYGIYSAPVTFGTSSGTFNLSVDTGSTTTAVAFDNCDTCEGVAPRYVPGTTATDTQVITASTYGDGSGWVGDIFSDQVRVGDLPSVKLSFAAIEQNKNFFHGSDCAAGDTRQGILGMGPKDLELPGTTSFFQAEVANEGIDNSFAVQLCNTSGGTLWLGGFDQAAVTAPPEYTPLVGKNIFYGVNVVDLQIDSLSVAGPGALSAAIVDTGTSVLLLPSSVFGATMEALDASSAFTELFNESATSFFSNFDCVATRITPAEADARLPMMTFVINRADGTSFVLNASATHSYLVVQDGELCPGLADSGGSMTVLGDTFLSGLVTIFDLANQRIGFAPQQGCP